MRRRGARRAPRPDDGDGLPPGSTLPAAQPGRTCRSSSRSRPTASATRMIRGRYQLNTLVGRTRLTIFLPRSRPRRARPGSATSAASARLPAFWTIEWRPLLRGRRPADGEERQPPGCIDTQAGRPSSRSCPDEVATGHRARPRNLTRGARWCCRPARRSRVHWARAAQPTPSSDARRARRAALVLRPQGGRGARTAAASLGPVGGTIVAERSSGCWRTTPPRTCATGPAGGRSSGTAGDFTMPDLITFTGHGLKKIGR